MTRRANLQRKKGLQLDVFCHICVSRNSFAAENLTETFSFNSFCADVKSYLSWCLGETWENSQVKCQMFIYLEKKLTLREPYHERTLPWENPLERTLYHERDWPRERHSSFIDLPRLFRDFVWFKTLLFSSLCDMFQGLWDRCLITQNRTHMVCQKFLSRKNSI